jgi:hypothetical protein
MSELLQLSYMKVLGNLMPSLSSYRNPVASDHKIWINLLGVLIQIWIL